MGFQILLQIILILLNAFFAASEIALISLNENKVRALADKGDKKAAKMLKIIENPTGFLSAIQVGITLAGFLGSAFAADNFAEKLTDFAVVNFNIAESYVPMVETAAVIIITLILSYFTLVFGELVPKRVAMKHKDKLARAISGVMSFLAIALKPVIWLLTVSTNIVLRLFRIKPNEKDESVSEEDIVIMLDAGKDEGTLAEDDIRYIKNVFKLDNMTAYDIMIPRQNLVAVPQDISNDELLSLCAREGYSRLPVYDRHEDSIIGIISSKEFLLKRTEPDFKLSDIIREAEFVPENMPLDVLLKKMQKEHIHMVPVVDEYGSVSGCLTMEDILEELVGEIWDEGDEEVFNIKENSDGSFTVSASIPTAEFFEYFDLKTELTGESATLCGYLGEKLGHIPELGDALEIEGLKINVSEADGQKIRSLSVIRSMEEV